MASGSSLNEEQLQAITYTSGPLLIIAGAGTGKTTVIVEKIKHLIGKSLAKPEEILALTFTEKAALEMEERVDQEMPYGYFQMWISTFHSFADKILREEISHIGLNPGYKLLTQAETILFIRNRLFLFNLKYFRPLGNPHKFLNALIQHFSRLRDEDISPDDYLNWTLSKQKDQTIEEEEKERRLELAQAYKTYQEIKIKEGFFDFSDLNFYLLSLFRKRPTILKKYQEQFKYVLVDEFQDTNISQYLLIKLLCPSQPNPNLTVVGDDSQAIYKFRGASISNILTFMKDYPQAKQITLKNNYRSYQSLLDYSHKLIQNNNPDTLESQLGISKKLIAQRGKKRDTVSFNLSETIEGETEYVAEEILKLKQSNNYRFSDFALLVRANSHAEPFINTFIQKGIPYHFIGPSMLFKQSEVKDLIAYLKLLYNIEDSISFYRLLTMDIFNISQRDLSLLLSFSKKIALPLYNSIEIYLSFFNNDLVRSEYEIYRKYLPLLHEDTKKGLLTIFNMLNKHLALIKKYTAGQILYYFLEDTGYLKKLVLFKSEKEEKIALNINKFFNRLKSFEKEHDDASVFAVVDYLDMSLEFGDSPLVADSDSFNYDAVNILTIHSAKGLEFPVVFLINLSRGRFPTYEKKESLPIPDELIKEILPKGDYHLQEERRLFYVGLTRAKDKLFLTSSQAYGEGKRERKLSPFVIETLGEEEVNKYISLKKEEKTQLSIFDFKPSPELIAKEKTPLSTFSFSQLETFNTCPLQYKYQYILKIPTHASAAASFGDSIHKTLQKFYQEYLIDRSISLQRLLEIFHQMWIPISYTSQSHQERMKKEGEKMITNYFNTFHTSETPVFALEKLFKIRIADNTFITGKIDRVDQQNNNVIEIIDYKTGKKPDEKELQKSLQLSLYALAATNDGLYQKKVDDVVLTFYYFQDMSKFSMKRTQEEMELVKTQVTQQIEQIRNDLFQPKVGIWCSFCSFKMICEAW